VGNWLSTGAAVAEIIALSPVEVRVFVPERYINRLQIGSPCNVFVRAAQQQPFVGHIVRIVPQAQMPARTYPVIVRVANPTLETIAADANTEMTTNHAIGNASDPTGDPLTKPTSESNIPSRLAIAAGMLADVELSLGGGTQHLLVAKDALCLSDQAPKIGLVDQMDSQGLATVKMVTVTVGGPSGGRVSVRPQDAAIDLANQWVIVRGNEGLTDGTKVRVEKRISPLSHESKTPGSAASVSLPPIGLPTGSGSAS
ncbi:MAG: HlyD family efflux transporter periplasmic adaptor subunit, partial [Planctomycetota bacterium]